MNKKIKKFLLLTILLIVGRVYDGYTTYLYTPDLSNEANPLVSLLGFGWTSIVITQFILVSLLICCLYYYLYNYNPPFPNKKKLKLKEFISNLNYNYDHSFFKIFYKLPDNRNVFFAKIGYAASMTMIFAGYIVGTSTTLLLISDTYRQFYKNGAPFLLYGILFGLITYFMYNFYLKQYRIYQYKI